MSASLRSHSKRPHISKRIVNVMLLLSSSRPKICYVWHGGSLACAGRKRTVYGPVHRLFFASGHSGARLLLMSGLNVPAGTHRVRDKKVHQTWYRIIARPTYLTALFSATTGFGIMVLAMTATPLAMHHHGYTLLQSTTVIQLHVLGMFLPSFITGRLIARSGVLNVMLAGTEFLLLYAVLTVSGQGDGIFTAAVISVGIGWNFLYIGGTTLLSTAISGPEKGVGEAFNDMSVAVCVLLCSLTSDRLLSTAGWERTNLMFVPWIVAWAALLVMMKTLTAKKR